MERDTRLHRANNNEEFVGTERRREAREDRREREEGIFRSAIAKCFLACIVRPERRGGDVIRLSLGKKRREKEKERKKVRSGEREREREAVTEDGVVGGGGGV